MDSERKLALVIGEMRSEIRKLELENLGLKRKAGNNLRRNVTAPVLVAAYKKSIVMTVRRYSVFQSLGYHHWDRAQGNEGQHNQPKLRYSVDQKDVN